MSGFSSAFLAVRDFRPDTTWHATKADPFPVWRVHSRFSGGESLQTSLNRIDTPELWRPGSVAPLRKALAMKYESAHEELLLRKAEDALETLKLYHQSFLQPNAIARVRPWETAVEDAFRRTEELRKFLEKELPDYTESLESHGGRLRMEFLRGLNLAERQFGPETFRESVARLIPVLDRTQEGRRLQYFAALAKPLIDLHALKDATDKLDGFTHLEWESAAKKAELSAAKLAATVKEKSQNLSQP